MPLNLNTQDIELLWLIQPNLVNQELDIKKRFDKPSLSIDVNDLMYITISSDFDYIYKLNPSSSSYRGTTTFFVFKVNGNSQTFQDYLVLKLNEDIDSCKLDSFMSYFMDYTDLLDLESSSLKNETLRKIFLNFKKKETCAFNKNEAANKKDVLNSLNFHHDVYIDKNKAEMITNGSQAIGNSIVSLAQMASNMIENIGTQISTNCEQSADRPMDTDGTESSITSFSDESEEDQGKETSKEESKDKIVDKVLSNDTDNNVNKNEKKQTSDKKEHSKRHHRHHKHSRKHRKRDHDNEENEEERAERRAARHHRRRARRAANLRKLNQFTKSFAETATIAATAISTAITETASYVVPAVEEYLPGIISSMTNYDEEASRKMVGSTLGYGKVALNAMSNIKNGVQESVGLIGSTVVDQTTQVVKSKYGEETAEETADALGTIGNVATAYTTIKKAKKII